MADAELKDWRGCPIEVGTRVLYRGASNFRPPWKIGVVVAIYTDRSQPWDETALEIEWEQEGAPNSTAKRGRGIMPKYVMVWPQ